VKPNTLTPVIGLTINEIVYRKLLKAILSGDLPPGTPITISQLAATLRVSLMPVREALKRLETQNLIQFSRNRRITITELSPSDVEEIYRIRVNLESMAARRAARRREDETVEKIQHIMDEMRVAENVGELYGKNREFHFSIYRAANMPILLQMIEGLYHRISPYIHVYIDEAMDYSAAISCHEGIIRGMREKNPGEVAKWVSRDLAISAKISIRGLKRLQTER